MRSVALIVLLACAASEATAVEFAPITLAKRIVVLDLEAAPSDQQLAQLATAAIHASLAATHETTTAAACIDASTECLAERAHAAGATLVLHGWIVRRGDGFIVSLVLFDPAARRAVGQDKRHVESAEHVADDAVRVAHGLLDDTAVGLTAPAVIGGGLVLGGGVVVGVALAAVLWATAAADDPGASPAVKRAAESAETTSAVALGAGVLAVVFGAGVLVGGLMLAE